MSNISLIQTMPDNPYLGGILEGLKHTFQEWVRDAVKDALSEHMTNAVQEDKLLTADELCERWHINKNTLHTREKKGIITPLNMDGKRKMYSLMEVKEVEISGLVKTLM